MVFYGSPNTVATLGVLTVWVKAGVSVRGGLIRVRQMWWPLQHKSSFNFRFLTEDSAKAPSPSVFDGSLARNLGLGSVTGKFGDPYSTKVPSSSVFEGSLTRMVSMETSLRKVSFFLARWARFLSYVHSDFRDVLRSKTSFAWQVQMVLRVISCGRRRIWWTWTMLRKGRQFRFCRHFGFGHDNDSVWQVRHFGCLGLIVRGMRNTFRPVNKCPKPR